MQPLNRPRSFCFISTGSAQLLVGPASSLRLASRCRCGPRRGPRRWHASGPGSSPGAAWGSAGERAVLRPSRRRARRIPAREPSHQCTRGGLAQSGHLLDPVDEVTVCRRRVLVVVHDPLLCLSSERKDGPDFPTIMRRCRRPGHAGPRGLWFGPWFAPWPERENSISGRHMPPLGDRLRNRWGRVGHSRNSSARSLSTT